jgi:hypothetical protein
MDIRTTMQTVDAFLRERGIQPQRDYIWSVQGPTLIYLGDTNPFEHLTLHERKAIRTMGVKFLVENF